MATTRDFNTKAAPAINWCGSFLSNFRHTPSNWPEAVKMAYLRQKSAHAGKQVAIIG